MWLILSMRKLIKQINLIWSGHDFPFHLGPFNWKRKISVQSINKQKVKGCLSGISISKKTRFKKKISEVNYNSHKEICLSFVRSLNFVSVNRIWKSYCKCSVEFSSKFSKMFSVFRLFLNLSGWSHYASFTQWPSLAFTY